MPKNTRNNKDKSLAKRLKKQLQAYKRKEKASRIKLRVALVKMKQMGKTFERILEQKVREGRANIVAAQSAVYEKLSQEIKKKAKKRKARKSGNSSQKKLGKIKRKK